MSSESKASDEFYQSDVPVTARTEPACPRSGPYPKEVDALREACLHGLDDRIKERIEDCKHAGTIELSLESNHGSMTPLKMATRAGSIYCVKQLLAARANPNDLGGPVDVTSPLQSAVAINRIDIVKALLQAGALQNPSPGTAVTPAMTACENGAALILEELLTHRGNVSAIDTQGNSALHHAVLRGHTHLTRLLLTHRGDPRKPNHEGKSAVDLAAGLGTDKRKEFERAVAAFDGARKMEGPGTVAASGGGGSDGT